MSTHLGLLVNLSKNDVEASIQKILEAYDLGQQLLAESGTGQIRGLTGRLAKKNGILEEQVRKFRVLADKKRGFSRQELEEQFRRFRREGKSLDLSHFIRSLALPRGHVRNSALLKALDENLSSHEFQAFISTSQPNRRGAGRKPKVMRSDNFDQILGRLVWSWNRVLSANLEVNGISNPQLEKKVKKLQRLMKEIISMTRDLDAQ